ncbi:MAG: hypothetical protein ABW000_04190 [Actinoplanes sp.]
MPDLWQPREPGTATDLVYRSRFTTAAPDLQWRAAEQFSAWIAGKGVTVGAATLLAGARAEAQSADGTRRVARSTVGSYTDRTTGRSLHAAAFRLDEHLDDGTSWTTSLRLAGPHPVGADQRDSGGDAGDDWPEVPWIWLDLEHHRGETGAVVRPGSPRLVRDLLAALEGTDGTLPLTSDLLDITASHVGELCGWLFDTQRRVPVIVFTPDPKATEDQRRFATRLARDVTGVAVVVRLPDAAAAAAFSRRVGPHLHVYAGAMRTYLPGLAPQEPFPRRHRVLSAATMRALRSRSADAVRDQVLGLSTRRPPPPSYPLVRRVLARGSALTGPSVEKLAEADAEIALLYAEIDDLTRQLGEEQRRKEELEDVRTERDLVTIDLDDSQRDNERLRARVRWLESELTRHQVHLVGVEPPGDFAPAEIPASVVEVLEFAAVRLPHLAIGATDDAAAGLDVHPRAEHWAFKIWKALAALNSYAEARRTGQWKNSFLAWCSEPPTGGVAVPATWTALSESETTNTKPKLREARTFAVPEAVTPAGRLYMPAHVKIERGGTPCPRIHFHDDAGGGTGRIYVGYVGDHLPTATFR